MSGERDVESREREKKAEREVRDIDGEGEMARKTERQRDKERQRNEERQRERALFRENAGNS